MRDTEAIKASYDPCDDSTEGCDDFPPGARRPETLPYRAPAQPPPTLVERLALVEAGVAQARSTLQEIYRDTAWIVEQHRVFAQPISASPRKLPPLMWWLCGIVTGTGFGGLLLFGLARGCF